MPFNQKCDKSLITPPSVVESISLLAIFRPFFNPVTRELKYRDEFMQNLGISRARKKRVLVEIDLANHRSILAVKTKVVLRSVRWSCATKLERNCPELQEFSFVQKIASESCVCFLGTR
jgi:hypothetical protein